MVLAIQNVQQINLCSIGRGNPDFVFLLVVFGGFLLDGLPSRFKLFWSDLLFKLVLNRDLMLHYTSYCSISPYTKTIISLLNTSVTRRTVIRVKISRPKYFLCKTFTSNIQNAGEVAMLLSNSCLEKITLTKNGRSNAPRRIHNYLEFKVLVYFSIENLTLSSAEIF